MIPAKRNQNNWLPSIFGEMWTPEWIERRHTAPALNILETPDSYCIEMAAPGMTRDDFKVHLNEENELVISMEKQNEQNTEDPKQQGTYLRRDFTYTKYRQTLLLPDNIERDKITASVENGIMCITVPKRKADQPRPTTRQIEVK